MTHNNDRHVTGADVTSALIQLRDATKSYATGSRHCVALAPLSLTIQRGECVAVVGPSGSGKTTLVNLLTGIDTTTSGEILVNGVPLHTLSQDALSRWRGRNVGIVFQFFQLLPTLTIAENVMLPMDFCDAVPRPARRPRALALLERLGIADQADKIPGDLSGGQQQRAAIARALANDPPLLIADEPTGNLDSATSEDVLSLLASLASDGKCVITVTHERDVTRHFSRTVSLRDGRVVSDILHTGATAAATS